ncbi:antitoxin [Candidatus Micrarchaeota archaeon]|nr:antitoxin [Candidatus Micrarchaeota archaeon]
MVRVITIMDDVYNELKELKNSKNMSFSEALRFLLKEKKSESTIIQLAGTIEEKDMYRRTAARIRRGEYNWMEQ